MREHADAATKQPFINIVRQFIQKVVIGKTPGHQPASLEVHGRIASILAAIEAATILEKQFEALKQHDYLERLRAGEIDTEQKQKKLLRGQDLNLFSRITILCSNHPPCAKPPPPRHLAQIQLADDPDRCLGCYADRLGNYSGGDEWPGEHQLDQVRQFRRRPPAQKFALHRLAGQHQAIVFLQPGLGRRGDAGEKRQQPGVAVAMPAAIDGNGL